MTIDIDKLKELATRRPVMPLSEEELARYASRLCEENGCHYDIRFLLAEIQRLRETLRWYADAANWRSWVDYGGATHTADDCRAFRDSGERAREALGEK